MHAHVERGQVAGISKMIIKITSPFQGELQVGDELEMISGTGPEQFVVTRVSHFSNGMGQSTDLEFEFDFPNALIPAGTMFRTPYCTWALEHPIQRHTPSRTFVSEYSGVTMPILTVDERKIISTVAELHKWPASNLQELNKLIQNIGSLIIGEVLAPVVEYAEQNLLARDCEQFYRLTREMFMEEMALVEQKYFPAQWGHVFDEKTQESVLDMTRKRLHPVATQIIKKASEKYGPPRRTIRRANAPWAE